MEQNGIMQCNAMYAEALISFPPEDDDLYRLKSKKDDIIIDDSISR